LWLIPSGSSKDRHLSQAVHMRPNRNAFRRGIRSLGSFDMFKIKGTGDTQPPLTDPL